MNDYYYYYARIYYIKIKLRGYRALRSNLAWHGSPPPPPPTRAPAGAVVGFVRAQSMTSRRVFKPIRARYTPPVARASASLLPIRAHTHAHAPETNRINHMLLYSGRSLLPSHWVIHSSNSFFFFLLLFYPFGKKKKKKTLIQDVIQRYIIYRWWSNKKKKFE